MDIEIPNSIVQFVTNVRNQTDVLTAISGAGIVLILMTWARISGLASDINMTQFRWPKALSIPLGCFTMAVLVGYAVGMSLTGYFSELVLGCSVSDSKKIVDAGNHFRDDYHHLLQYFGITQLLSSLLGILSLVLWFVMNILKPRKGGKSCQCTSTVVYIFAKSRPQ